MTRAIELLHQHRARLIALHIQTGARKFKPQQVLDALEHSLKSFPNNSIFHVLYYTNRQRYGLMDRLRDIVVSDRNSENLVGYLASIRSEMQRPEFAGRTEHSIRAAFLRAGEEDSPVRSYCAIRLLHVQWELSLLEKSLTVQKSNPRKKGKTIDKATLNAFSAIHSALMACPWVKEIYLTALSSPTLRRALEPTGTRSTYTFMLDRGIRTHIDISDLLND